MLINNSPLLDWPHHTPKRPPTVFLGRAPRANGYSVAREYVDEAESGRVADRPEFRKMIEEGSQPKAPFEVILVEPVSEVGLMSGV